MKDLLFPYGIKNVEISKLEGYASENHLLKHPGGKRYVLKYYKDPDDFHKVQAETKLIDYLRDKLSFDLQRPVYQDKEIVQYEDHSFSRLLHFLDGKFLAEIHHSEKVLFNLGKAIGEMSKSISNYGDSVIESLKHSWDLSRCLELWPKASFIENPSDRKFVDYFFDQYRELIAPKLLFLRHSIIHNDWNDWNILFKNEKVTGLIDFGDICYAPAINELAVALTYTMLSKQDPIGIGKLIIEGYCEEHKLEEEEVKLLYYLIPARLCQSVCHSAERKALETDSEYVLISEKPAWELLRKWISFNPIEVTSDFMEAAGLKIRDLSGSKQRILQNRRAHLGHSLSLSYDDPIHMVGAAFQYMYDSSGNTYLDAYNNIPHIGHCHPRVSEAISCQTRKLNTNTRYLYDSIAEYTDRLISYFPNKLERVFYVNSGSEASDLAVRIARNFNGRSKILVLKDGYHGNSTLGIEISSYKFEGKGGLGPGDSIEVLPLPKEFRGEIESGEEYARDAIRRIQSLLDRGIQPSAFIAESISGCGGQVPLAGGYWKTLKPFLDEKGILSIADEVQVGFGRVGSNFWAFELHDIIPDIVILGKPMGNGHPIGAIVTTTEIAEAFDNGMEFFSSFGGNPISMAVANAVLQVIEEEGLQQNAREVGNYFEESARNFQFNFPEIGDIRCKGLFLGIEFMDPDTNQPHTSLARRIKNSLRENLILTGTDGPFNNVLKMKPPLCFTKSNVDHFFEVFHTVLTK